MFYWHRHGQQHTCPTLTQLIKHKTLLLSNIRSLLGKGGKTKVQFLSDQAQQLNAVAIAVTESWLNPDAMNAEVTINFPGCIITNIRPTKSLRFIVGLISGINLTKINLLDLS